MSKPSNYSLKCKALYIHTYSVYVLYIYIHTYMCIHILFRMFWAGSEAMRLSALLSFSQRNLLSRVAFRYSADDYCCSRYWWHWLLINLMCVNLEHSNSPRSEQREQMNGDFVRQKLRKWWRENDGENVKYEKNCRLQFVGTVYLPF